MLLHHCFIRAAKKNGKNLFLVDRTLGRRVTYHRALIGALILARAGSGGTIWASSAS